MFLYDIREDGHLILEKKNYEARCTQVVKYILT